MSRLPSDFGTLKGQELPPKLPPLLTRSGHSGKAPSDGVV